MSTVYQNLEFTISHNRETVSKVKKKKKQTVELLGLEAWCQTAGRSWPSKKGTATQVLITYGTTFKKDQIKDNDGSATGKTTS